MIVFGWNHFKIKSFDPYAMGLSQQPQSDFTIEVRQKYFHLFWIPFFGLGKIWAIRRNNQLLEIQPAYKDAIRSRQDMRVKTPWYTFAGPLLALLVGCGFMINEKVENYQSEQYNKKQFSEDYENNAAKFRKPSLDDYYIMTSANGYTNRYARITGLDKNNIQLSYITDKNAWSSRPADIAKLFIEYADHIQTITLSRGDSTKLICKDYDSRKSFTGIPLQDGYGMNYRVEKIFRLDGPILKDGSYASYSDTKMNMEIANEGLETTIIKIETLEGEARWLPADTLPLHLPANKEFMLYGEGNCNKPYKVKFTCAGNNGQTIQFLMEGQRHYKQFTRIN
jgi:hypothetical protein